MLSIPRSILEGWVSSDAESTALPAGGALAELQAKVAEQDSRVWLDLLIPPPCLPPPHTKKALSLEFYMNIFHL